MVLYACYAVYVPFDDWTFLRFLLPAIALLLLLCSVVISEAGRRAPSFLPAFLLVSSLMVFLAWRWDQSGLRAPQPHDRRFAVVGEYVERNLPPNAILFSLVHSGSIRYYSGRVTLRWDWLPDEWLDRSVSFLKTNGYQPFLLIEQGWERQRFIDRFSGHSRIGSLSFTPMATYIGPHDRADLYDLGNPDRPVSPAKIQHVPADSHTERSAH
jgi:hypothetical protein